MKVLVAVASKHGSTAEIAETIGKALNAHGLQSDVQPAAAVSHLGEYDAVLLGSGLYAGRWLKDASDFAKKHQDALRSRPVWLFSSGPVGRPKSRLRVGMERDPVELPAITQITGARGHHLFAGRLEAEDLNLFERAILVAFGSLAGDFRDWQDVDAWANEVSNALQVSEAHHRS